MVARVHGGLLFALLSLSVQGTARIRLRQTPGLKVNVGNPGGGGGEVVSENLWGVVSAAQKTERSLPFSAHVMHLNDSTFDSEILQRKNTLMLTELYINWCPHCRQFTPKWSRLATLVGNVQGVWFAAIDCAESRTLCSSHRFKVNSVPTITAHIISESGDTSKVGENTGNVEYNGVREWVKTMLLASRINLQDQTLIERMMNDKGDPGLEVHIPPPNKPVHEHPLDLSYAVFESLLNGVFLGETSIAPCSENPTTCKDKRCALVSWMNTLSANLPGFDGLKGGLEYLKIHSHETISLEMWLGVLHNQTTIHKAPGGVVFPLGGAAKSKFDLCAGDMHGFPCGLWQVFHSLVSYATDQTAHFILQQIREYVERLFLCKSCQDHFASMASSLDDSPVTSRREGVLWLWKAHNNVTRRLAPIYKIPEEKVEFPSAEECPTCRDTLSGAWLDSELVAHLDAKYRYLGNS
ncbi:hypothetical protein AAMO2058_000008100 [Amorphochlora amoebiformis]